MVALMFDFVEVHLIAGQLHIERLLRSELQRHFALKNVL